MMRAAVHRWLRARGWGGFSPYRQGHDTPPQLPPAQGPQPQDYARLQALEATVSTISAARARFDRELRDFERETGGRGA